MVEQGQDLRRAAGAGGQTAQAHSEQARELALRLKRFALVLTGDEALSLSLVNQLPALQQQAGASAASLQYMQFKNLFEIWSEQVRGTAPEARIFKPGHENEAIQQGLDPAIAAQMGALPSLYRALLLLICGENFSYAATAQLLNISIEELMMALSLARGRFMSLAGKADDRADDRGNERGLNDAA